MNFEGNSALTDAIHWIYRFSRGLSWRLRVLALSASIIVCAKALAQTLAPLPFLASL